MLTTGNCKLLAMYMYRLCNNSPFRHKQMMMVLQLKVDIVLCLDDIIPHSVQKGVLSSHYAIIPHANLQFMTMAFGYAPQGSSGMSYCNQTPFPPHEGLGLGTRLEVCVYVLVSTCGTWIHVLPSLLHLYWYHGTWVLPSLLHWYWYHGVYMDDHYHRFVYLPNTLAQPFIFLY